MEKELSGFYGSNKTPCIVFFYKNWYCVEGSVNVNKTFDNVEEGVNVEELNDVDFFTASKPINDIEDLIKEVDE